MLLVVFQFDCVNTLNDQVLENVTVQLESGDDFEVLRTIPIPLLPYDKPGTVPSVNMQLLLIRLAGL